MPRIDLGEVTNWTVWELQAPVSCLTPVLAADLTGSVVPGLAESRGSLSLSQSLSVPGLSSQTMPQVPQTSWTHVTVDDIHTSDTPAAIFPLPMDVLPPLSCPVCTSWYSDYLGYLSWSSLGTLVGPGQQQRLLGLHSLMAKIAASLCGWKERPPADTQTSKEHTGP